EVRKRYSKGLLWQIAYTFGRSIDTGSDITAGNPITEYDGPISNRGLSDFHQQHRANFNWSYRLPWFAGQRGFRNLLMGGWTFTGNATVASGNVFTVTSGYDVNADGVANDRPILLDQSLYGRNVDNGRTDPVTGAQISTHQLPLAGFYGSRNVAVAQRPFDPGGSGKGSLGRNTFFGQGMKNLDFGLYKAFKMPWEGHQITFRAEAYGLTNTPRFAFPFRSIQDANFGRISSTYNPLNFVGAWRSDSSARVIQFALRYTF
ncbi:MAG: hypothetical protein MUC42_15155, partial [Bryobacter sp.]|nr:hypothetical protein [Bryobacter sp.]